MSIHVALDGRPAILGDDLKWTSPVKSVEDFLGALTANVGGPYEWNPLLRALEICSAECGAFFTVITPFPPAVYGTLDPDVRY